MALTGREVPKVSEPQKLPELPSPHLWKMPVTSSFPEHSVSCTSASASLPLSFVPGSFKFDPHKSIKSPFWVPRDPRPCKCRKTHSSLSRRKSPEPWEASCPSLPARRAADLQGLSSPLRHTASKLHHSPPPSHDVEIVFSHFYFFLLSLKISIQIFHLLYNIHSSSGNENNHHREVSHGSPSLAQGKPLEQGSDVYIFRSNHTRHLAPFGFTLLGRVCLVSVVSFPTLDFSGLLRVCL